MKDIFVYKKVIPHNDRKTCARYVSQKEGREEEDIVPTPKGKGRKSDTDSKKKTPKKTPEDGGLKKRLNILYRTAYDYTV